METFWWYVESVACPMHSSMRIRKVTPDALTDSGFPLIQSSIQTLNIFLRCEIHNDMSLLQKINKSYIDNYCIWVEIIF